MLKALNYEEVNGTQDRDHTGKTHYDQRLPGANDAVAPSTAVGQDEDVGKQLSNGKNGVTTGSTSELANLTKRSTNGIV